MDNFATPSPATPGTFSPVTRTITPDMFARAFANLPPTGQTIYEDSDEKQQANLSGVHVAARTIGQKSKTAPRGSISPLQRWNSERRQSTQGNTTHGLQASLPASNTAPASPGHISITITPPQASTDNQLNDVPATGSGHVPPTTGDGTAAQRTYAEKADSDSESIVEDGDESDEEFGNLRHPQMAPQTRANLEDLIFAGKDHTTLHYKQLWEAAKREEDQYVKDNRAWKYGHDFAAGAVNQFTSFGLGGIAATALGTPWLFPPASALLSELLGDRLAQLIRRSTIIPTASREHFENHRRPARELGDLIAACKGKDPKKPFSVEIIDSNGKKKIIKMTAAEALEHTGWPNRLSAFGKNLLVRGLPFLWFAFIYWPRDYYINDHCKSVFYPNATGDLGNMNSTSIDFCPHPQQVNVTSVCWALQIFGGMMAGGMTMLTNQLLSRLLQGDERTTYSTRTLKLQADYLRSACLDTKAFLDGISSDQFNEQFAKENNTVEEIQRIVTSAKALDRLQKKSCRSQRKNPPCGRLIEESWTKPRRSTATKL